MSQFFPSQIDQTCLFIYGWYIIFWHAQFEFLIIRHLNMKLLFLWFRRNFPPRATLWLVWWGWSKYRSHDQLLDCPHDCPHNRPHESPWVPMTDNNCEIRAGRWESAQDIKIFHSGARNPRRRLGNDQRLISVEKLSRSSNPSSTLSMNLPAKVMLSKKSPHPWSCSRNPHQHHDKSRALE